jgi:hypothetical protein
MKELRESFTARELDLLALYLTRGSNPDQDADLADFLASLDIDRYHLYQGMRDSSHCLKHCENPVY